MTDDNSDNLDREKFAQALRDYDDLGERAFHRGWSENAGLDLRAIDEVTDILGYASPGALVEFLRSEEPISRYFREVLADAVEDGRVRIVKGRGRPRSDRETLLHRGRQLEIGFEVARRVATGEALKNAIGDVAKEIGLSPRSVRKAMAFRRLAQSRARGR